MKQTISNFISRNMPVLVIGGITCVVFIAIIVSAQFQTKESPAKLEKLDDVELIAEHTPRKGTQEPQIQVVEFSDFECPACAYNAPIIEQLADDYGDSINLAFRHFPLISIHAKEKLAAIASQVANSKGKFWEYSSILFANQTNLSKEDLIKYAEQVGIDAKEFEAGLNDPKFADQVNLDRALGISLGINETPSFYVNGKRVKSVDLKAELEKEIEKRGLIKVEKNTQTTNIVKKTHTIEIGTESFAPQIVYATAGDTIKWVNKTSTSITIKSLKSDNELLQNPQRIGPSEEFTLEVKGTGLWNYVDSAEKMRGAVYIKD